MINYTPMIQQYISIKADYKDAFLFFRLGDFYEMFFDDAKIASKILDITLTGRDGGTEDKIPMCGVPYHSANTYISKLVEKGYKVAVCEQVEDPKSSTGIVKREVVRVITPGTIIEGRKLEEKNNNYICSIVREQGKVGFSAADISTGEFYATELNDDNDSVISEIYQYHPSELIIVEELLDYYNLNLSQINLTISVIQNNKESYINLLREQFKNIEINSISSTIVNSIGQLLTYILENQKKKLLHLYDLKIYDNKQFMVIDPYSKKNLELVQTQREQAKIGSLLWLLDRNQTSMGSRLIKRWIDKPLLSLSEIKDRLNVVEDFFNDLILYDELANRLADVYDIERIVAKVSSGSANPKDLYNLKISISKIEDIYHLILDSNAEYTKKMLCNIDLCNDIAVLIDNSIQENPPTNSKDGGIIKRGYNKLLDNYYALSTEGKDWLKELEQKEKELTGIKSLKVSYNKVFGYYIEVTKSNLCQVPDDRYIRKQTLANAERYITEELKIKEAAILEAEEKMLGLEYQLYTHIKERIAMQSYRLLKLSNLIAKLDVLSTLAAISREKGYIRPTFNEVGKIYIENGRHPVIEALKTDENFFPNNTTLNQDNEQILIITGPNMSGKSTYMRQIAQIIILAQIGSFVPASKADLSIVDRVFTRIGAGDDITSGQSTFMVEMLETKQAIMNATPNSLILLDEIGRGTSTYDGMALAQAIIQYIHDRVNAKTLFSTHYHELTSLEELYPRIKNIHVSVLEKDNNIIFLHKIKEGKADKSYGIYVAELAGMPMEVINNAKLILNEIESKNNTFMKLNQIEFNLDETDNNGSDINSKDILNEIREIDFMNLTPMEGFKILYDIHLRLRK